MSNAEWALTALGFARRANAPLLNSLLGVRRAGRGLGLTDSCDAPAGPTELGVLADMALGVPARARHGRDFRLVTSSMDVALSAPPPATSQLRITPDPAATTPSAVGSIHVVGQIAGPDRESPPAGTCGAAFSARETDLPPLPWETGERAGPDDRLDEPDLDDVERAALAAVGGSTSPPGTAMLEGSLERGGERCVLHPSAMIMNRAGAVQGGLVFGFAVTAALTAGGESEPGAEFSAHLDFAGPATAAGPVEASVSVLRSGRRQRLVRVDLVQAEELVATATVRHPVRVPD